MRNLKYLAPFSSVANFVTIISFGIIAYYIFREPISLEGRVAVGTVKEFPLFFGTVLFALEAIGVVSIAWKMVCRFSIINNSTVVCILVDSTAGERDENSKIIRRKGWCAQSSHGDDCVFVRWHGTVWLSELRRSSARFDHVEPATTRSVSVEWNFVLDLYL